jgi:hypothetical protein
MTIGEEIASKLGDLGIAAAARTLDPWPSMTPETGEVIVASIGGALRPVAHASTWVVRAAAPPSVGPAEWRWGNEAYPIGEKPRIPYGEIAANLAKVIVSWQSHADDVGMLEVALGVASGVPEPRGGLRVSPSSSEALIGVERGNMRWPHFAYVREREGGIEIVQPGPSDDVVLVVKTRADLRAAISTLGPRAPLLEAFSEKYVAEKTALERHAARLVEQLATLPKRGRNFYVYKAEVESFTAKDAPAALIDATSGAFRVASMQTTAAEIAKQTMSACPIREGYRYRVKQAFRGLDVGDVITLVKDEDIRPNDTRLLTFDKTTLSEVENAYVLDSLGEWLEWIDE